MCSLAPVMDIVGKECVSGVARKLLATLKLAMEHTAPHQWLRCALAWKAFIEKWVIHFLIFLGPYPKRQLNDVAKNASADLFK